MPTASLLDSVDRYICSCLADETQVFVRDALFPYLTSLLAWGYEDDEIERFFAAVADRCTKVELVQIHLDGPARAGLVRAGDREGSGWLDELMARVTAFADHAEVITDFDGLTRYYSSARERSRRILESTPWPILHLDSELGAEQVAAQAVGWIASHGSDSASS